MLINVFLVYAMIFLLSAIPLLEAYIVIPVGILGGLNPLITLLFGLLGNILTVFFVVFFIDQVKRWFLSKKQEKQTEAKKSVRARQLFNKYGVPGLSLLGPLLVGSHITAFFAVTFGGTKKAVFLWVTISIVIWSIVFSLFIYFGIDILGLEDKQFIKKYLNVE